MLQGIKVIELGTMISAPFGTYLLADLGAEVLKIEPLEGDPLRHLSNSTSIDSSAFFDSVNQGKKSIAVDFNNADERKKISRLISDCDILIHNYLPKTAETLGFGFETVSNLNADIIYISVNGFGSTTAYANKPGLDMVFQGLSGMMSLSGESSLPMRTPSPIIDLTSGIYTALMAAAALQRRRQSGKGAKIDVSMLSVAMALQSPLYHQFFSQHCRNLEKKPNQSHVSLSNCFKTRDGHINISITKLSQWHRLKPHLSGIDLHIDESSYTALMKNERAIFKGISAFVSDYTSGDILALLDEIGIPSGAVLSYEEVLQSDFAQDAGAIYHNADTGNAYIRQPYQYDEQRLTTDKSPVTLGGYNRLLD